MALIRWEPARELVSLQNEMNRLFGTFFDSTGSPTGGNGAGSGASAAAGSPRWTSSRPLTTSCCVPTCPASARRTSTSSSRTTCSPSPGERKSEHEERGEGYYRVERASGAFSRSLTLPEGVDPDGDPGKLPHGVLEVRVPKPEERKPRRVAISVGGRSPAIEGNEAPASQAPAPGMAPAPPDRRPRPNAVYGNATAPAVASRSPAPGRAALSGSDPLTWPGPPLRLRVRSRGAMPSRVCPGAGGVGVGPRRRRWALALVARDLRARRLRRWKSSPLADRERRRHQAEKAEAGDRILGADDRRSRRSGRPWSPS